MKEIRRSLSLYALLFFLSIFLSFLLSRLSWQGLLRVFSLASAIFFCLLVRQYYKLRRTQLIYDNPIVHLPLALLFEADKEEGLALEEVLLSTFGLVVGGRIYFWGLKGSRLISAFIDSKTLAFTFGRAGELRSIEILHNLKDENLKTLVDKLYHETGVRAKFLEE